MPGGELGANAMCFAMGGPAYNLGGRLRRQAPPETYRTATVATLRRRGHRLAGKLVRPARLRALQVKADLENRRGLVCMPGG